jgi:asparagine synthase (glutamine-hydrolysing)
MCGIAGAVGALDDAVLEALRSASDAQAHRGPDAADFWASRDDAGPGVAFAHRRLAIIDLSADGVQPMHEPESGLVVCFNGEIYDFPLLRRELEAGGAKFRSRTDTEVLLHGYRQWGEALLPRLRGMFAFALWDPAARRLLLARDRLGIKPLYLARVRRPGGDALLFASELRALLATGLVERRLDPTGLATVLWHGFPVGPGTLVRGVERLDAGVALTIDLDGMRERRRRYWTLPAAAPIPVAQAREALAAELEVAVRMRLVADVPVGVFLSGGIDSSAVTALATRAGDAAIRTFNVSFDEARFDESPHARRVAERLGTEHHEIRLSAASFTTRLDDALGALDQPTFDAVNTYFVSRAVRDAGITVALAGTGGDELFGGYTSFRDLPRMAAIARLARFAPALLQRTVGAVATRAAFGRAGEVAPQLGMAKLGAMLGTGGALVDLYQLSYALFLPDLQRALAPGAAFDATHAGLPRERADALAALVASEPALHGVSLLELASFIGERLLPDTDAASMAVSLEVRVPLLDHRVVEAAAAVPVGARFEPVGRKQLLRDLALGGLDPALFERPKQGFELPFAEWMRGALRKPIEAVLHDRAACAAVGLDSDAVATLWRAHLDGAPGLYWSRPWSLFTLVGWCRRHRVAL